MSVVVRSGGGMSNPACGLAMVYPFVPAEAGTQGRQSDGLVI
jgi:hypothetical protein